MSKPTLPQGTRDFGPAILRKRNHILDTIRNTFELYGFEPLETPAMENLETLMGKYGEEGDKLIFRILNNGLDNPAKADQVKSDFEKVLQGKSVKGITERALRYDLTIPFARYVAMNHGSLHFPFRRYQIQPVWRADRPQKGRYREFYQCDADVVGSYSLRNEIELAEIYATVFEKLGIDTEIKINSRKILSALATHCGGTEHMTAISTAIDKLDKIGMEKVKAELAERGLNADAVAIVETYLSLEGSSEGKIAGIKKMLGHIEEGQKGIEEIETVLHGVGRKNVMFDPTLARGLNYYTGIIFEVIASGVKIGSIGGGGRYDDLTGLFGVPGIPGVGISFGVDRIYDVMEELAIFPEGVHAGTRVLFFNLGDKESARAYELVKQLRQNGVAGELYHENVKFDKQFKYAEKKNIPFVVIIGEKELEASTCNIKNLITGEQSTIETGTLLNHTF